MAIMTHVRLSILSDRLSSLQEVLDLRKGGLEGRRQWGCTEIPQTEDTYIWITVIHEGIELLDSLPDTHAQLLPFMEILASFEVIFHRLLRMLFCIKVLDSVTCVGIVSKHFFLSLGSICRIAGIIGLEVGFQGIPNFGGIDLGG